MYHLVATPPKRFFAFGCSFTRYFWTTWANIIGKHLEMSYGTKWYNFGKSGIGNEAIANLVSQANLLYTFTEDDLVIVCWTNIARKDTFTKNSKGIDGWWGYGNIFSSPTYPKNDLKKISFTDLLLKNLTHIELVRSMLKDKCQTHFIQMCQVDTQFLQNPAQPNELAQSLYLHKEIKNIYSQTLKFLYPSFYEVVWHNDIEERRKHFDPHPLPSEHFKYIKKTFYCAWHPNLDKLITVADNIVIKKGNKLSQRKDYKGFDIVKVMLEFTKDNLVDELLISKGESSNEMLI